MRNFLVAVTALREQRNRSILSATGIAVAAIAIVLLVSIALGVKKDIREQVEDLGVNTLIILPGQVDFGTFNPNIGGQSYLKPEHATKLATVPGVIRTCAMTFVGGGIRTGEKSSNPFIIATTAEWFQMRPLTMRSGKVFAIGESERVTVIGSIASDELFGKNVDSIGKSVVINGTPFRVVGVTTDKKSEASLFSMGSLQNVVYIPAAAHAAIAKESQIDRIFVQSAPDVEPKSLVAGLNTEMAKLLDKQQFSVLTQEDLLNLVFKVMSILTWLLVGLTSIALFVGGVGIMTVMLMSVNERAYEIGIRKTVGATRKDLFQQFLVESVLLAILGGLAGLAVSSVVALVLNAYTPIKPTITFGVILTCFGTCIGVGAVFGLIPALRAAAKDPVDALRDH